MPEEWTTLSLGGIAAIAFSGVDKHTNPGELPVRLCNYLDVYRNRRLTQQTDFPEGSATPTEIRRLGLQKGDVVITKDSETPDDIGVPALVEDDLDGVICGYHLARIRPDAEIVVPGFLRHYMQSDAAKRHFLRTANGLTRFGLVSRAVCSLPVMLPPLTEQAVIARILDAVEAAKEGTLAAVVRVRELKRACLQEFFYRALGPTAYADRPHRKPPPGWTLVPTRQLLADDPRNGLSPESSAQPPGTPTFSIAAIRDGHVKLESCEHLKYAHAEERVAERYRIRSGDVLVVRGNANSDLVGAAAIVDQFPDGCIYPDITMRIVFSRKSNPMVLPEYAVLAWNHAIVHNQVLRRAKTSNGTLKINSRDIKQIVMPVPPQDEQAEICRAIQAVDSFANKLSAVGRAQDELKKSLAHDLLSGRVRVADMSMAPAS